MFLVQFNTLKKHFLAKSGAEIDEDFVAKVGSFIDHFYGQKHLIVTMIGDNNINPSNDVLVEAQCIVDHHRTIVEHVQATPRYVSLIMLQ